jgi:parvulin-like peptidyl-prolyl isomerase
MKLLRISLAILGSALVLVAMGCAGGGQSVPADAVAVVDGSEISRADLDELIARAKKTYESQDQEFPKAGTPEYQSVQTQYVKFLVQLEEFEQEAEKLGVEVTEKDVDEELQEFIKTRFAGKRADFEKALEEQGFTEDALRETLRTSVLSQKLFDEVTKDVEVPEADIVAYYQQNQASYGTPESRDVRHILISEKSDGDEVDFAKSKEEADRIHAELLAGGDFAALAKTNSDDPGSKAEGGKLTITRGQTVPEFDKVSFDLKQGTISEPVKTTYGYHIIEALSPVRKAKTTPLAKVRASIKATLLQENRTTVMTEWVQELEKDYEGKVSYAAGFEPPELPEDTNTETETVTE